MSIRDLILEKFWWKLLSFLLATLIWFNIQSGLRGTIQLERSPFGPVRSGTFTRLPVKLLTERDDFHSYKVEPQEVEVTLAGEISLLRSITPAEIEVFVSIPAPKKGRENSHLFAGLIKVVTPSGVTVERINPRTALVERLGATNAVKTKTDSP